METEQSLDATDCIAPSTLCLLGLQSRGVETAIEISANDCVTWRLAVGHLTGQRRL